VLDLLNELCFAKRGPRRLLLGLHRNQI
jgi:hypothetical protein